MQRAGRGGLRQGQAGRGERSSGRGRRASNSTNERRDDGARDDSRYGGGIGGRADSGRPGARGTTSGGFGGRADSGRPGARGTTSGGFGRRGADSGRPGARGTTSGGFARARGRDEGEDRVGDRYRRPAFRAERGRGDDAERRPRRVADRQDAAVSTEDQTAPEYVAGRHPVLEALKSGRPINKLVIADSAEGGSLTEILGKAKAAGLVIQRVPKAHLAELTGGNHHQGVVAYVAPHDYAELEDVLAHKTGHAPLVVLLDEVTDPYNFGAVLRSAEATGVQGVIIPKRRSAPLTGVVAKVAAGALEYVPVARVTNLVQAIERLKQAGFWIVGTDVEGSSTYTEVDYSGSIAVVIGAEGKGLSRLVKERCDYLVQLPMLGKLQSLNASVAAGVLLYEVVRQRA